MNNIKFFISIIVFFTVALSCSKFSSLKENLSNKDKEQTREEETIKEETISKSSQNDLTFYNKYIDVVNKIQDAVEQVHKSYIENVPEPKSIKKSSFILVITADMYVSSLERTIKELNRSFYDGGELAKLEADNKEMKNDIENAFRNTLKQMEEYHKTARMVIDYYKNKDFTKDLSPAAGYDTEMKDQWEKSKEAYKNLSELVKKYKPKREYRNPDKITNPDERSIAVLMNAYENVLDGAELFYGKFENADKNTDWNSISSVLNDFESGFKAETDKINSTTFTDRTKALKYNFEDYFTKTVNDFINEAKTFISKAEKNDFKGKEFNKEYDNVIRYYNYMINSYNTSTQVINSYNGIF